MRLPAPWLTFLIHFEANRGTGGRSRCRDQGEELGETVQPRRNDDSFWTAASPGGCEKWVVPVPSSRRVRIPGEPVHIFPRWCGCCSIQSMLPSFADKAPLSCESQILPHPIVPRSQVPGLPESNTDNTRV